MTDFFAAYAVDPKTELEGKEFDFGGGVTMLIARSGNTKYNRLIASLYEVYKHTLELKDTEAQKDAANERSDKIMVEVMAKSVLLGWTGPVMYKGEPLPYSVANAEKLLTMKDFQREVTRKADDFRNFRVASEADDVKKLSASSNGSSNGEAV